MRPRWSQDDGTKTAEDPSARKLWGARLLLYVTVLSRLTLIISANWLSTANSVPELFSSLGLARAEGLRDVTESYRNKGS